jgi:hypothetical protein
MSIERMASMRFDRLRPPGSSSAIWMACTIGKAKKNPLPSEPVLFASAL